MINLPVKHEVTSIIAVLDDYCLPCYYLGSDAPEVIAVPVYRETTAKEFYESLKDEFNATEGWFDMAGSGTMAENALYALVSTLKAGGFFEQGFLYASSVYDEDSDEPAYAYVSLYPEAEGEEA